MKKILTILFLLFSCTTSYAQLDSSTSVYAKDRGVIYMKASSVPSYLVDGFRAKVISGDTLLRVKGGGVFTAGELSIYANGTDMTTRLNNAANLSYVNSIKIVSDSSRGFSITGTVNSKRKEFIFENGSYLTGAGTVDSATITAGDYTKVADTTVNLTAPFFSGGHATPQMFGAKGDGIADDTRALKKLFSLKHQNIYIPDGKYKFTQPLRLDSTNNLECKGLLIATGVNGTALTIGSDSMNIPTVNATQGKTYYVRLFRSAQSDWSDSAAITVIGLRAKNLYRANLTIEINGFTCNALLTGDLTTGGFVESKIYPIGVTNGYINIWCTRTGAGYFNSNTIYTPSIRIDSGVNPGQPAYGIVIGTQGDAYLHNNNNFTGGSIQLNGNNRIPILLNYAYQNRFEGFRTESNNPATVKIYNTSNQNVIKPGFAFSGTYMVDISSVGNNIYIASELLPVEGALSYKIFDWTATGNSTSSSATSYNLKGVDVFHKYSNVKVDTVNNTIMRAYSNTVALLTDERAIGVEIKNTNNNKKFIVKRDVDASYTGRVIVSLFDSTGRNLSNTHTIQSIGVVWTTAYGGSWYSSTNNTNDFIFTIPESAKSIRIMLAGLGGQMRLRGFSVHVVAPSLNATTIDVPKENYSTGEPSWDGTFEVGRIIYNYNPTESGAGYWQCTQAGTNRSLSGASISITSGNNYGSVTGISLDSVYAGEYVSVNSVVYKIVGKSGSNLYFNKSAGSTYSGSFNYYAAAFIEKGKDTGGTGGGGGGSLIIDF